ncbi:TadE/TadG family type IV pilus assembly protein [uncultured Amphritea sp.]|uniref:TadE/TadG family type IV pilus assembly protein n=1 Tax=Amphritea sp. TaxID=1872502 RepID=UPI0025E01C34|nr:TadE/TadG family type IV pilus assembly protein [uncultured Amphritea sp.]
MNTFYQLKHQPAQRPRSRKQQLGVAAVEFTITLPVLLLLLFVGGEMGRFLFQYNTLTKSVQDSARFLSANIRAADSLAEIAAVNTSAENLVRYGTEIVTDTTSPLLPGFDVSATNPVNIVDGATEVSVTATYTYDPIIFPDALVIPLWQGIQLAVPLTASVTMPRL